MSDSTQSLYVQKVPAEVLRGVHMVTARRRLSVRAWVIGLLYAAIDEELADYPEWRYQSERPAKKASDESEAGLS